MSTSSAIPGSFRDPSGFLFQHDNVLFRQINRSYRDDYQHLIESGLYSALVKKGWLIPHENADISLAQSDQAIAIIQPERIPYISYPYEWSFSQIKDAALLTLRVHQLALKYGMILKDASAYNVQFHKGKPVFIDTLSFAKYEAGPWLAYKQFCQHFYAPLCLMVHTDQRLSQLFRVYIDGVPLDLVSKLLPKRTWLNYSKLVHIHIHARSQIRYADSATGSSGAGNKVQEAREKIGKREVVAIARQLTMAIEKLNIQAHQTEWGHYYESTNYEDASLEHKKCLVKEFLQSLPPPLTLIQDFGANNGMFSRIAAETGAFVVSQDIDEVAVDNNYLRSKMQNETSLLPLLLDLTNPSPGLGWSNGERDSALMRSKCDVLMALALIHHIALSNNVPLGKIAFLFSELCNYLVLEFVPKQDSQVIRLLATREDVFPNYTFEGFEAAFTEYFKIERCEPIEGTERKLYLLKNLVNY